MMYTQEQLTAMTADQLKAAILELQGQAPAKESIAPITEAQDTAKAAEMLVQADIEGMKAAIAQFEVSGAKTFPDALAMMKQKLADAEAEAKKEAEDVKDEVQKLEEEEATWAENFRTKHGVSWQVALIGGAFVVWQVGAAVARVLGVA
jgi:hypothetical protein